MDKDIFDSEIDDLTVEEDGDLDLFGDSIDFVDVPDDIELNDEYSDVESYVSNDENPDDNEYFIDLLGDVEEEDEYDNVEDNESSIIYSDDLYSEIDDETEKFISALNLTLKLRLNPMDTESDDSFKTRYHSKNTINSSMKEQVNIIKDVLDLIQKYNQSDMRDTNMLPEELKCMVKPNQLIQYNDKEEIVWKYAVKRMYARADGNGKKLNKILDNIVGLRSTFGLLCESYSDSDRKFHDVKISKPINDKINKKRFAFYHECLNRLNCGEKVALCRDLTFDKYDELKYKFKCGNCKNDVFGIRFMQFDDGKIIKEGDNHNFYQVITLNGKGLHYPLVCEECGAINCLPFSIRRSLDDNINAPITKSSNDKNEYVRGSNQSGGKSEGSDSRRSVPYKKWLDMLGREIEDREFTINCDSISDSDNGFIVDVSDDDYVIAIKSFRDMNKMLNRKIYFDKNGIKDIDFVLASISSKGMSNILRDICESLASYVIDTSTFKELSVRKHDKDEAYDEYLRICSLRSGMVTGEVSESEIHNFESVLKVKITDESINKMYTEYYDAYLHYKSEYNNYKDKMLSHYRIFSFRKKDKKKNALEILCDVMGNDSKCLEFILSILCDTLSTEAYNNMRSSFNMKISGKRISNLVNIKQSRIHDKEHMRAERYSLVKTYLSELIKRDGGSNDKGIRYTKIYKEIGSMLDNFDIDFYWYQKYCEWRDMFSLSDIDKVDDLVSNVNSGAIFKSYSDKMCTVYRSTTRKDIKSYSGCKLGDMKPNFLDSDYFRVIFNTKDENDSRILRDMNKAIFNILNMGNFQAYDLVFSKLMILYVGLEKFTGYNSSDVSAKLNMTDGLIAKLYDDCCDTINNLLSEDRRFYNTIVMLSNHDFVYKSNYDGNLSVLSKYVDDVKANGDYSISDDIYDELYSCLERIKNEFNSAACLDDEFLFSRIEWEPSSNDKQKDNKNIRR